MPGHGSTTIIEDEEIYSEEEDMVASTIFDKYIPMIEEKRTKINLWCWLRGHHYDYKIKIDYEAKTISVVGICNECYKEYTITYRDFPETHNTLNISIKDNN